MKITTYLDQRITRKDGLYPIYVRITDKGVTKLVNIGYRIDPRYWAENSVKRTHPQAAIINAKIADIISEFNRAAAEASLKGRPFKIDLAASGKTSYSFIDYIFKRGEDYEKRQMPVMWNKCRKMIKELKIVFGDIHFDELNMDALRKLEAHMIDTGNSQNTRNIKFAFYRTMLEGAITEGLTNGKNIFKEYKIKKTATTKEKLTLEEIQKIENLELAGALDMARDIFLFSFYCKGQRFSDCLYLESKYIKDGRIFFITDKAGKAITVKIHDRLQRIIDKYPRGKYLFGYIKSEPKDAFEKLRTTGIFNAIVNRYLKIVAGLAQIDKKVSMHIARHSFASQLMNVTDSIHVIKEALAHSDYRTTQIYLKSLDDSYLDKEMDKLYGK